jgi:hypothetical protein
LFPKLIFAIITAVHTTGRQHLCIGKGAEGAELNSATETLAASPIGCGQPSPDAAI